MKYILLTFITFGSITNANASPQRMQKYLNGEISANDYVDDLIGPMNTETTVYGPHGEKYIIRNR